MELINGKAVLSKFSVSKLLTIDDSSIIDQLHQYNSTLITMHI